MGREERRGVRFRLFAQAPFLHPGRGPETIMIDASPHSIGPGPCDERMYLIDPVDKHRPYGVSTTAFGTPFLDLPPWRGVRLRPVYPDADGHFDHIPVDAPEFERAHVFGSVRFVLDHWQRYFGRRIPFHFERDFGRLEIVMLPAFDNAHVGYGFMEVGAEHGEDGRVVAFSTSFDVLAHEFGHLIVYGTLGVPDPLRSSGEYFGFQEAAADITAIISSLHFVSLVEDLLSETRGNLYTFNELSRFAELSAGEQIRMAANGTKMSAFAAGWDDEHELSQPLTGALFDVLVDIYQEVLVEQGLLPRALAELSREVELNPAYEARIQARYDAAFAGEREGFAAALERARDALGVMLAETWQRLPADDLSYALVGRALLGVDLDLTGGRYQRAIGESFAWREIGRVAIGPRRGGSFARSHSCSARTLLPSDRRGLPRLSFKEQMLLV